MYQAWVVHSHNTSVVSSPLDSPGKIGYGTCKNRFQAEVLETSGSSKLEATSEVWEGS